MAGFVHILPKIGLQQPSIFSFLGVNYSHKIITFYFSFLECVFFGSYILFFNVVFSPSHFS